MLIFMVVRVYQYLSFKTFLLHSRNLQAAICSYFDCNTPVFSMALVKDVTIGEGESVPPNTM